MSQSKTQQSTTDDFSIRLGMPTRHVAQLCRDHDIRIDPHGRPDLEGLASALALPELPELIAGRRRVFIGMQEATRLLGVSPPTVATRFGGGGTAPSIRTIRIAPRIRYVLASDLDRALFGDATEITDPGPTAEPNEAPAGTGRKDALADSDIDLLAEDISGLIPAMKAPSQERKK